MSFRQFSKILTLSGICLVLLAAVSWLQAQEAPPRPLEFALQVIESGPDAYYLPAEPLPEVAPTLSAPADLPTSWTYLIFETYRGNNWNIYSVRPNGSSLTQLVNHSAVDSSPVYNRGATEYLFVSNRDGNPEIYKAATNGSYTVRLTNNSAADLLPAWSPDNSQIAFQSARSGNYDIFVMDANGGNVRQLTFSDSYDGAPSWSPDGRQLVFSSRRTGTYELWIMDASGANQRRIPHTAPALYPSWSPNGDKIAFTRDQNNNGWFEIWTINTDGSGLSMVADESYNMDSWLPTWSPDGNYLAFVQTFWVLHQGQYYWTLSYIHIRSMSDYSYDERLYVDDRSWKAHWGTADATPPGICTVNAASLQRWPQVSFGMTATDDLSGIQSYDAQYRRAGGNWTDLVANSTIGGATYAGGITGAVDFRCRATDVARNSRSWDDAPIVSTTIDAAIPTSAVKPLPAVVQGSQTTVQWEGQDVGTGITSYDVYVKDGAGDWTLWQNDVTIKTAVFNGTVGHTYQFRSQATDGVGHTESWRPEADTAVTFYTTPITHTLSDNRGVPVAGAMVTISPTAVYSLTTPGLFHGYLVGSGSYTTGWTAPGYGGLPATSHATNAPFLAVFPPVDNVLSNGDFEQPTLLPWAASDPGIQPTTAPHTGQQAVTLPGIGSVVTISQSVSLPVSLHQPTLSFLYRLPTGSALSAQAQTDTLFSTTTSVTGWQHAWADLTPYAGQTITLTFNYTGTSQSAFLDDVTVGSWHTPQVTAVTPTPTQAGDTLTINGANFIAPVTVLLDTTSLVNVTWVNNSQLTAQVPGGISRGSYSLSVKNSNGATAVAATPVLINNNAIFLPIILANTNTSDSLLKAAWPTLGQNAAHTGYQSGDPGASRYTQVWQTTLPYTDGVNRDLEQIAIADGVLVATSDEYFGNAGVIALNAYTGQERWRYSFSGKYSVNPPTIAYGNVFFQQGNHGTDSYLFSLNLYNGVKNWQAPFSAQWESYLAPIVVGETVYMNAGSYGGMQANNAASGSLTWFVAQPQYDEWTPAYAGGQVYTWVAGYFTAHTPETGAMEWSLDVGWIWHGYDMDTAPVIADRTAFVVSPSQLTAINLDTRQIRWSSPGNHDDTMPAVAGNEVYALRNGHLQVRQVNNGTLLWQFAGDGSLINAPVVTDRYVYVASAENTYVLDRATHQIVWQVDKGGWLSIADGYLYIAQPNKTITAYRAQEP